MTLPTFPTLATIGFPKRSVIWSTVKQPSVGGQESRFALWSSPRWSYDIPIDLLRQTSGGTEFATLAGFYNALGGPAGTFQYADPNDGSVTQQVFGTGDGSTTAFQLVRSLGGFNEPVYLPITPAIYRSDWQNLTLLVPSPRTNLLVYSVPTPGNGWNGDSGALTSFAATAPDGSGTVGKYVENGSTNTGHQITAPGGAETLTVGAATPMSLWCKPTGTGAKRWLSCLVGPGAFANFGGAVFDVVTGTVSSVSVPTGSGLTATIVPGLLGWYRCCISFAPTSSAAMTYEWRCASTGSDIFGNYIGDGTSGLLIWGGQLENNAQVGSAIPTSGAAATVTDYVLGATGIVTCATAPVAGAVLAWTGMFNWLCRFDDDSLDFQQFGTGLWSMGSLKFSTVKL